MARATGLARSLQHELPATNTSEPVTLVIIVMFASIGLVPRGA